ELLLRQRVQRPRAAAIAGRRPRHRRTDRLWGLSQPRSPPLRLRARAERSPDPGAERGLIRGKGIECGLISYTSIVRILPRISNASQFISLGIRRILYF